MTSNEASDRLIPDDAPGVAVLEPERQVDYFISRRGTSAIVAQEVADVLRAADYSVLVQDHDIPTGANFVLAMHDALKRCRHFVALLSKDYDSAPFTLAEWTNFYAIAAQSGGDRRFIVLRIEDCNPQGLFSAVIFGDLVGIDDPQERRARILAAAEGRAGVVERRPRLFENIPPPDLNFVGREPLVAELHELLVGDQRTSTIKMAAIHGLGGVGKTLLAAEYVHRHAAAFGGVWWAPAQERTVFIASLAALAARLDRRLASEPNQERAAHAGLAQLAGRPGLPILLVYDNVEAPDLLRDLLPPAGARVLVTTRWADWGGQAVEIKLDPLSTDAAAAFLQKRALRNDPLGAARLAVALGNLPLALDHAGAFCRLTRTSFESYIERTGSRILRAPKGASYPASVAATFGVAIEKVAAECPAAEKVLGFCAFLAPEMIPLDLISDDIANEEERVEAMMALAAVSLIEHPNLERDQPVLTVHRLVQAAMRARLAERGEIETTLAQVMQNLSDAFPQVWFRQIDEPVRRGMLLPHVLAARDYFRAGGRRSSPGAGRLFCAAGRFLEARGDYAEAEPLYRDAVEVMERTFGRNHADRAMALHDLALLLLNSGQHVEAEALIPQAIETAEKTLGEDDADAVMRLNILANLLTHVERIREAEPHYRHAITITEKLHGREHPSMAGLLNNLGNLLRNISRHKEAENCYREAIAIGTKAFGEQDPGVARYVHNLANLLRTSRRFDEAEPLYRQCIATLAQALGEDYAITARAQRNLAILLLLTKRPKEALPLSEMAFRSHAKSSGDSAWLRDSARWLRDSARTYAQALDAVGRKDEAAEIFAKYPTRRAGERPRRRLAPARTPR